MEMFFVNQNIRHQVIHIGMGNIILSAYQDYQLDEKSMMTKNTDIVTV